MVEGDAHGKQWARTVTSSRKATFLRVHLLDTAQGDLARAGIILRLRAGSRDAEAAVKWRCTAVNRRAARALRATGRHLRTDLDVLPDQVSWGAKIAREVRCRDARAVARGSLSVRELLSRDQRLMLRRQAPEARLQRIVPVAAIDVVRARFTAGAAGEVDVEIWNHDGLHIVEVSTRCRPRRAWLAADKLSQVLHDAGIHPAADQHLKTDTVLLRRPCA